MFTGIENTTHLLEKSLIYAALTQYEFITN